MKETVAIYHWWPLPKDPNPYQNLRAPILLSIASLRSVSDVKIIVLQNENNKDWGKFPNLLNFEIVENKFYLEKYADKIKGYRHLSRIYDLNSWGLKNYPQSDIVYVDSDVFFFKDPFPLECATDRFCWDGWNTGFFYYNQSNMKEFMEVFDCYIKSCMFSEEIKTNIKKYVGYDAWYDIWDEMILSFMKKENPDLFHEIPSEEHATVRNLQYVEKEKAKIFHANGTIVSNPFNEDPYHRGLLCLLVKEFREKIEKVIDIKEVFEEKYIEWSNDKIFSILDNSMSLEMSKDHSKHYDINLFLSFVYGRKFI